MSSQLANHNPNFKEVTISECLNDPEFRHASHCMIYSSSVNDICYGLLQMRFDGLIGFAGGEVDVKIPTVNDIVEATNRELEEEINYNFEGVKQTDWICSHLDNNSGWVLHFFAKELTYDEVLHLEKTHMKAEHFPSESLGIFRVPIGRSNSGHEFTDIFMKNFLRQKFAGNARQQFIQTIRKRHLLTDQQIKQFESIDNNSGVDINDGIEVKTMLRTELAIDYHNQTVDVIYGLMVVRDNGLFDFIGTDFVKTDDKDSLFELIINGSLKKDVGSDCLPSVSQFNESQVLYFDDNRSQVIDIVVSRDQFTLIEESFIGTENFNRKTFGLFRIPLEFRGITEKADNYFKRFFSGFLKQNFVNNSKLHLKSISDNIVH